LSHHFHIFFSGVSRPTQLDVRGQFLTSLFVLRLKRLELDPLLPVEFFYLRLELLDEFLSVDLLLSQLLMVLGALFFLPLKVDFQDAEPVLLL
jgi:hypothetical protein